MSQSKAGKASGKARRSKTILLKEQFIEAVRNGSELTKTGVVAPRTYQSWLKKDPQFAEAISAILEKRRIEAAERARLRQNEKRRQETAARQAYYKKSVMHDLYANDIYIEASKMIGRKVRGDVRESAISELIVMMLSGEKPDPKAAMRTARGEFSYYVELSSVQDFIPSQRPENHATYDA